MSAPVLSISEQKASISGKKKKRKTVKNVLTIPSNLKTEPQALQADCIKTLKKILERLLPTARIAVKKTKEGNSSDKTQLKTEAKSSRNQLSLGVNSLNRNIKNDLISAVLLADNIQPKFFIHHLNLLCNHKKIPFVHMPGLREITNNCLGFPCIAVGFKKSSSDFSEAVNEIISISKTNKISSEDEVTFGEEKEEVEEDEEEESTDEEIMESEKKDETPFTYLYRTSTKERVFVPEKSQIIKKEDSDFICVEKLDKKIKCKKSQLPLRLSKPLKKQMKVENFVNSENSENSDNEDLEVPKKKPKKDWVIDKRGSRQNIKYYTANLTGFLSNPDRIKK